MDPATLFFRVFSFVTGKHITDEVLASPDQYFACATDCLNQCHWVVSVLENNRLGVRRLHYPGAVDSVQLDFAEKLKIKKRKEFSSFIKRANRVFLHYLGSSLVPEDYLFGAQSELIELLDVLQKFVGLSLNFSPYGLTDASLEWMISMLRKCDGSLFSVARARFGTYAPLVTISFSESSAMVLRLTGPIIDRNLSDSSRQ
jgi:hypothetical protein